MSDAPRLTRATPVLRSADYPRSRDFYTTRLAFRVVEEGGSPPRFGIFERDRAVVFVDAWHGGPAPRLEAWEAYFHVESLRWLHAALTETGAEPGPVRETVYGMSEFEVLDPDGNRLCFGEDTEAAS